MHLSEVRIHLASEGETAAYADVTPEDCFWIKGFKLVRTVAGYVLLCLSYGTRNTSPREITQATRSEIAEMIIDAVIAKYRRITGES